ncbi:hypothetical protein MKX01_017894 [Papaver californicum]|nr:hypothetical protein MKX01_017894 [Papaver californicum]
MKASIGDVETENHFGSTDAHLRNSASRKSSKRVKFASHVEVFPPSDDKDDQEENPGKELIRGKRFTRKEDQVIKDAVHSYIKKFFQSSVNPCCEPVVMHVEHILPY